jgi:hypothetical protein
VVPSARQQTSTTLEAGVAGAAERTPLPRSEVAAVTVIVIQPHHYPHPGGNYNPQYPHSGVQPVPSSSLISLISFDVVSGDRLTYTQNQLPSIHIIMVHVGRQYTICSMYLVRKHC